MIISVPERLCVLGSVIIQTNIAPALPSWFDKRIRLATGLSYSGSSVGTMAGPFFIVLFAQIYGLRGAFILIAGIWMQLIIVGALQRPPPVRTMPIDTQETQEKCIKMNMEC